MLLRISTGLGILLSVAFTRFIIHQEKRDIPVVYSSINGFVPVLTAALTLRLSIIINVSFFFCIDSQTKEIPKDEAWRPFRKQNPDENHGKAFTFTDFRHLSLF